MAQNKNIDGIQQIKRVRITRIHYVSVVSTPAPARKHILQRIVENRRFAMIAVVVALVLAFAGGILVELNTHNTLADTNTAQSQNIPTPAGTAAVLGTLPTSTVANIPADVFYNLTLDQVEGYLHDALKTPETKQAELLAERKAKLITYLNEKHSPLVNIVDTLITLKHWQVVLAISNSESSLGKRCYTNNCSGIGVEPGHPLWREYSSKSEWAKDLDRLIEKRYKNWTLEEMNGVYNKPGSANWISASRQILEELQERTIE